MTKHFAFAGIMALAVVASGAQQRDPEQYARFLESSERVAHMEVDRVVTALHLQSGETVADLGSGSGLFTRALAREVGEFGITVNAIAPGPIDTDIMGGTLTDERKAQMSEGIMMGRVGTREEVAALIAFLLGPDAGYITAATYDINGGLQVS